MRALVLAPIVIVSLFSGAFAKDLPTADSVAARLEKSEGEYRESIDVAKKDLLKTFGKIIQQVTSDKRLKVQDQIEQLNQIKSDRQRFESDNRLPESPVMRLAVSDYKSAIQKARRKYQAEVEKAATAYRDLGDLERAERTLKEGAKTLETSSEKNGADKDWIALFNGKDLTGWRKEGGDWAVVNGILRGSGPHGWLVTDAKDFANFRLRVRAMINDGGNSGVFFRHQAGMPLRSYEAQINSTDRKDPSRTGSLWIGNGRESHMAVKVERGVVEPGKWFWLEIVAAENKITISVDDQQLVEYVDLDRHYSRGAIAIQQHHPGSIVMIESVEIKPQP